MSTAILFNRPPKPGACWRGRSKASGNIPHSQRWSTMSWIWMNRGVHGFYHRNIPTVPACHCCPPFKVFPIIATKQLISACVTATDNSRRWGFRLVTVWFLEISFARWFIVSFFYSACSIINELKLDGDTTVYYTNSETKALNMVAFCPWESPSLTWSNSRPIHKFSVTFYYQRSAKLENFDGNIWETLVQSQWQPGRLEFEFRI